MKILTYIGYGFAIAAAVCLIVLIILCAVSQVNIGLFITLGLFAFFGVGYSIIEKITKGK